MTRALTGQELSLRLKERFPSVVQAWRGESIWIDPASVRDVCRFLKEDKDLDFNFLNSVSAVDYIDHFEIVYHLTSLNLNHSAVVKAKVYGRENPSVPSVYEVWRGADFQEREVYDLMGVAFDGHPNLKRIMLWDGFPGHPHRKDFEDVVKY
jgi:NADH-quinone oxidoreductase subunit C